MHVGKGLVDDLVVVSGENTSPICIRETTHSDEFAHGEAVDVDVVGKHQREEGSALVYVEVGYVFMVDFDRSVKGRLQTSEGAKERTLARAIGASEAYKVAWRSLEIEVSLHSL